MDTTYTFSFRPLAEALYDALIEDAFYVAMENSVGDHLAQRREAMLRYYDYSMREAIKFGRLHTSNGSAQGASIWSVPIDPQTSRQKETDKQAFIRNHMGSASLAAYIQITASMARHTRPCVPSNSWYLSILGIAPAFQGQGFGQTLMRPALIEADRLGAPAYLETFTPRNMRFYRRLGFQERAAVDEPVTGARYWIMIRKPYLQQDHQEVEHVEAR